MSFRTELLTKLLEPGERPVATFLAEHPELVYHAFARTSGHASYVLKEFPFGSRFKADFVVLYAYSGVWEVHMVELELPSDPVITKKGIPSQRLNGAVGQVLDWHQYFQSHRAVVQEDLSHWCIEKDLLGWMPDSSEPRNFTGDHIRDPSIFVDLQCHIIIGRRAKINPDKRNKMNQWRNQGFVRIGTYDRFVDIAQNLDRQAKNPGSSVWISELHDSEH